MLPKCRTGADEYQSVISNHKKTSMIYNNIMHFTLILAYPGCVFKTHPKMAGVSKSSPVTYIEKSEKPDVKY